MLAVIFLLVLAGALGAQSESLTVAQIYERATERRTVALDESVSVTVALGAGIHLDCADNDVGLASAAFVFAEDGPVWIAARDVDGFVVEHSGSGSTYSALLNQIGGTRVVAVVSWSTTDGSVQAELTLSGDRQRNRDLRQRAREKRPAMSYRFSSSAPFPDLAMTEAERTAGWARLWSEVKYNFAFFDQVPDVDWDAELEAVMPAVIEARSASAYYRVLARSLARLRDGHTDISGPGLGPRGDAWLPVRLAFDTQHRVRVAAVTPLDAVRSAALQAEVEAAGFVRGERITHWDGEPVEDVLDRDIRPYICASTPQGSDLEAARILASGGRGSRVTLRVVDAGGDARDVILSRARFPFGGGRTSGFEVRELDGDVLYVNLPSFSSESVVEAFERTRGRLRKSEGLILDVRGNGGGNSAHAWRIIRYLVDTEIPKTRWKTREYRPAYRAWGADEEWHVGEPGVIRPALGSFGGPVAVLVGPATFSAAEDFVAVLHAAERATVVGRPTGGSTGQPLPIALPGGGTARVCTKRDTYPDGRDFVGVGIVPDVLVDPFDHLDDDDPELTRALEIVRAAGDRDW